MEKFADKEKTDKTPYVLAVLLFALWAINAYYQEKDSRELREEITKIREENHLQWKINFLIGCDLPPEQIFSIKQEDREEILALLLKHTFVTFWSGAECGEEECPSVWGDEHEGWIVLKSGKVIRYEHGCFLPKIMQFETQRLSVMGPDVETIAVFDRENGGFTATYSDGMLAGFLRLDMAEMHELRKLYGEVKGEAK